MRSPMSWRWPSLLVPLLASCSSWSYQPAGVVPVAERLQVWRGGQPVEVRTAVVTEDSIVGRDSAGELLRFARHDMDSVRVRRFDVGKTFLVVFGVVPASAIMLVALDPPESF